MDEDLSESFYISNDNDNSSNLYWKDESLQLALALGDNNDDESVYTNDLQTPRSHSNDELPNSPKLVDKSWLNELNKYFKLNNLLNCLRNNGDEKHDISISNGIMNSIIYKKLGSITYHYKGRQSKKAYHTYEYPEIYYNKQLYSSTTEWIKNNFK
jgi:hypothetical protein